MISVISSWCIGPHQPSVLPGTRPFQMKYMYVCIYIQFGSGFIRTPKTSVTRQAKEPMITFLVDKACLRVVYVKSDRGKSHARDRYIIVSTDGK